MQLGSCFLVDIHCLCVRKHPSILCLLFAFPTPLLTPFVLGCVPLDLALCEDITRVQLLRTLPAVTAEMKRVGENMSGWNNSVASGLQSPRVRLLVCSGSQQARTTLTGCQAEKAEWRVHISKRASIQSVNNLI